MTQQTKPRPVLITTERRGVFFGYTTATIREIVEGRIAELSQARNVVKWTNVRGFLGLAATGPNEQCRVGPAAEELVLESVTSAAACTEEAAQRFEAAPWG